MAKPKTIYVSAIYISPPNTMGGNTKILIELINNLFKEYHFVVFTSEPETFVKNIHSGVTYTLVDLKYPFRKFSYITHLLEVLYVYRFYTRYLKTIQISQNHYFYSASDFAPDVLPVYWLKKKFKFKWISSLFLFVPNPLENIRNAYKFPLFKYSIYFLYQRSIFYLMIRRLNLCLVTNDLDKKFFPRTLHKYILALYGGVNVEQIEEAERTVVKSETSYDAVFCSRLHQQKGIAQLLDIWKSVTDRYPSASLAVIGSGEYKFENKLRNKCRSLNIEGKIVWLGYVNNVDKFKIYLKSRVFIHPTIYDNNGMVATEALCAGLPVLMYNLPAFHFYNKGCFKVPRGAKQQFADGLVNLLKDPVFRESISPSIKDISDLRGLWSWKTRAKIFRDFLNNYEKYSL